MVLLVLLLLLIPAYALQPSPANSISMFNLSALIQHAGQDPAILSFKADFVFNDSSPARTPGNVTLQGSGLPTKATWFLQATITPLLTATEGGRVIQNHKQLKDADFTFL